MKRLMTGLAILVALTVCASAFAADWGTDTSAIYKRDQFTLNLGAMFASFGTSASLDSTYYGYGTDINFQRDLGFNNKQSLWRVDGSWRFTPRQQLYFSYMDLSQHGDRTLGRTILWGNTVYNVGADVKGEFKTQQLNLYYRFSFVQGNKGEFGGSIGLSWVNQSARLQGWGQVAGTMQNYYANVEGSVNAPVPVIGLFGTWQFTDQLSLSGDVNYLKLNVSGVDGEYTDARVTLDYYPWKNYGFGIGYLYDDIKVDSTKASWYGSYDYKFDGWLAYFKMRF